MRPDRGETISRIIPSRRKSRGLVPALLVMALLLVLIAMTMACAQVAHEDPRKAIPSKSMATSDQISALLGRSLVYFDNVSYNVMTFNFTQAGHTYYQFNQSCVGLENMIWQLNGSNPDYDAIGASLNSTNVGLADLLDNAHNYDNSRQLYNNSVASDDLVNVSVYKVLVSDRYSRIINSYDDVNSNVSALSTQLQGMDVDTRPMQDAMNSLDSYISWLNGDYGSLGIGGNGSVLYCGANQSTLTVGSDVKLSAYLVDSQGQPITNSAVSFFIDNRLIGSNTTSDKGRTSLDYILPATIQHDQMHAQAEYVPAGGTGVYSSPVLLQVTDLYTTLSLGLDKTEVSYGDTVVVSGQLSPIYGVPAGGRTIDIVLGNVPAGTAVTSDNGSYEYDLSIVPETPVDDFMINGEFQPVHGDVLLGSVSDETSLNITAQNTTMTLNCPSFADLGSETTFNGTLFTAGGKPVSMANVYLYIDDQVSGNGTTDDNGVYMITATIPDNGTAGTHEVFTSFNPGIGVSLNGSSSSYAEIGFNDTGKKIHLQGVPLVLFADDHLNMTGTLLSGAGAPITNSTLYINAAGLNATMAVTDESGNFNTSYVAAGGGLPALSSITISDAASSSILYQRQVLLIPIDNWKAFGILVILAAIISGAFVIARRPGDRGPVRSGAKRSAYSIVPKNRPNFDVQREIALIKAAMDKNDSRTALILIYAAVRKAVALSGVEVTDAMTEEGFYNKVAAAFPPVAPPLRYIVISYQSAVDTHSVFTAAELEMALKCLVYIDRELTALRRA